MAKKLVVPKTSKERSKIMAAVRQHGTAPELAVRQVLSSLGLRYRLNVPGLPGHPDIANRKRKFAILVHGCFWHRHLNCRRATVPKENREFWLAKFRANIERDKRNIMALRHLNYRVLVIWECETVKQGHLMKRLRGLISESPRVGAPRARRRLLRSEERR